MKILKKWREDPRTLAEQGLPEDWFETTESECLDHTENSGYWKPGTVVNMLWDGIEVQTPTAFYKKGKQND